MKTIAFHILIASSFISAAAISSPCAWADENTGTAKSAPRIAAEQKADLVLWQRSGAAALLDASSYDSSLIAQYQRARERYYQWSNGPELGVELQKLGFTKTLSKTD